jgi:hypothetical protein
MPTIPYKLCLMIWCLVLCAPGCGEDGVRRCIERAECFAGEYCARGKCAPYKGRVDTEDAPDHGDLGPEPD